MVQLIAGNKGRGKTTELLNRVNTQIRSAKGSIVYLDKSSKHMYELNNKVRLIDVSRYPIENSDQFVGFICGIISQDHDLEALYLDGFMKCAHLEDGDVTATILALDKVSEQFGVDIVISVSVDKSALAPEVAEKVVVAL